jgi:monoamine oxidase
VVAKRQADDGVLDLAVIGAGAAGTYVAHRLQLAHSDWAISLFERTDRIGGRLWSMAVPGLEHPIELGGMRFLTSHPRVAAVVAGFELPTHPFDPTGGVERSFLRGRFGTGQGDAGAGAGYDLPDAERGRSAQDLGLTAFEQIVPGASDRSADDWMRVRERHEYLGRPVIDWSIAEAMATVLSPEAYHFVTDAFGYDAPRAFNVADGMEYILGDGRGTGEARTPDDGMDAIPRALARAFGAAGGAIHLGHELSRQDLVDGVHRLTFANGLVVDARRVVLALPAPALGLLAGSAPVLDTPAVRATLASVEAFPAVKLYLWYDRPWWLDDAQAFRITTDLPPRKLFYFGSEPDRPAALLASYTDGLHSERWRGLVDESGAAGAPAPPRMVAEAEHYLDAIHPSARDRPAPTGSAFSSWGSDPHEMAWAFWRAGVRSDDMIRTAVRPIPGLDLFVCGDTFSRAQGWVEGALETADLVVAELA